MLHEDGGVIIPVFVDSIAAARSNIAGVKLYPQGHQKDFASAEFIG